MISAYTDQQRRSEGLKKIILCFDGTGNRFQANESDTNVVKIYEMLNRSDKDQFQYYQRQYIIRPPAFPRSHKRRILTHLIQPALELLMQTRMVLEWAGLAE